MNVNYIENSTSACARARTDGQSENLMPQPPVALAVGNINTRLSPRIRASRKLALPVCDAWNARLRHTTARRTSSSFVHGIKTSTTRNRSPTHAAVARSDGDEYIQPTDVNKRVCVVTTAITGETELGRR